MRLWARIVSGGLALGVGTTGVAACSVEPRDAPTAAPAAAPLTGTLPECRTQTWVDLDRLDILSNSEGVAVRRFSNSKPWDDGEYFGQYAIGEKFVTDTNAWYPYPTNGTFPPGSHSKVAYQRKAFCGQRQAYRFYSSPGIDNEEDWNFFIVPKKSRFFPQLASMADYNGCPATGCASAISGWETCEVGGTGEDRCCADMTLADGGTNTKTVDGRRKYVIEAEVTSSARSWYDAQGIFSTADGNIHPGNCQNMCVYGAWVQDALHNDKPEVHPAEAMWWPTSGGVSVASTVDATGRFDEAGDFEFPLPEPSYWEPWGANGLNHNLQHQYQIAFTAPDPAEIAAGRASPRQITINARRGRYMEWSAQSSSSNPKIDYIEVRNGNPAGGTVDFGDSLVINGTTVATTTTLNSATMPKSWTNVCIDHRYYPARVVGILNVRARLWGYGGLDNSGDVLFDVTGQQADPVPALPAAPAALAGCSATSYCDRSIKLSCNLPAATTPAREYKFQVKWGPATTWGDYTSYKPITGATLGPIVQQAFYHPAYTTGTFRTCVRDYALQETCGNEFTASTTYTSASCNTHVAKPHNPGPNGSCGASACTTSPSRPATLVGRVVSIVSAKNAFYTINPYAPGDPNYCTSNARYHMNEPNPGTCPQSLGQLRCLDVANASYTSQAGVNLYPCHNPNTSGGAMNQRFVVTQIPGTNDAWNAGSGRGSYYLRSLGDPTLCLNMAGGNRAEGEDLQLYPCSQGANEKLGLPGKYAFSSTYPFDTKIATYATTSGTELCLDAYDPPGNGTSLSNVEQWACTYGWPAVNTRDNVQWALYDWDTQTLF